MATDDILYSDRLVTITDRAIRFHAYYFPWGSKQVWFSTIQGITAEDLTWSNGKYRFHGSSDLVTWFPRDWHRPSRSRVFFIYFPDSARRIGFTVEDEDRVERLLRRKGLLLLDHVAEV